MFRQYRVILRQPVINTLRSYTSISNADTKLLYSQDLHSKWFAYKSFQSKPSTRLSFLRYVLHSLTISNHMDLGRRNKF
jgi:hypothetical protein